MDIYKYLFTIILQLLDIYSQKMKLKSFSFINWLPFSLFLSFYLYLRRLYFFLHLFSELFLLFHSNTPSHVQTMEVEYSGCGVLIFSYVFLIHQFDNCGGLRWAEAGWYEWVHWLPLWWPANSCSVISDKLCQT